MDKDGMLQLGKDLTEKASKLIEASEANMKTAADTLAGELRKELGAESEAWKGLQKQLDEIQTEQKKAADLTIKGDEDKPIELQMKEAIASKDFKEAQKAAKDGRYIGTSIMLKASDITNDNSITNQIPDPMLMPGISASPYRTPFLRDIVTTLNTNSPVIFWYEETSRTDGSAATDEAGVYTQGDQAWTQYEATVRKITEYQKYSDEMAEDDAFLLSVMRNKLLVDLALKLDSQQYNGNGSAPNLKGIMSYDTAYSVPTGLANNVDSPNYYDILLAAHTQVTNAYFRPTAFIMHPTNVAQLMTGKTSTAQYQAPPWVTMNGGRLMVLGLPVIANSGVTVNTFTVGDFKKINLAIRKDIDIRLWDQNSTDPIYGLKTITATMRAAQFASAQDLAALVTGSLNQTNLDGLASA